MSIILESKVNEIKEDMMERTQTYIL